MLSCCVALRGFLFGVGLFLSLSLTHRHTRPVSSRSLVRSGFQSLLALSSLSHCRGSAPVFPHTLLLCSEGGWPNSGDITHAGHTSTQTPPPPLPPPPPPSLPPPTPASLDHGAEPIIHCRLALFKLLHSSAMDPAINITNCFGT